MSEQRTLQNPSAHMVHAEVMRQIGMFHEAVNSRNMDGIGATIETLGEVSIAMAECLAIIQAHISLLGGVSPFTGLNLAMNVARVELPLAIEQARAFRAMMK